MAGYRISWHQILPTSIKTIVEHVLAGLAAQKGNSDRRDPTAAEVVSWQTYAKTLVT